MSKAVLTVEGYLSKDAQLARTNSGDAYLNLSVAHTPRKKNRDTGEWEDAGDTLWVQFTLWREDAEVFAPYAVKGTLVRVEGEPQLQAWEAIGKSGVNLELRFPRASIVPRQARDRGQGARSAPTGDPWATPAVSDAQADAWASDSEAPF